MEPLIKLRLLSSKLDEKETDEFIENIINALGAERLIIILFNGFVHEYKEKRVHNNQLQTVINAAKNIIDSRKKKKRDSSTEDEMESITFQMLPYDVIGECVSYLQQTDYMNLSITNREIYCATNTPNALQHLDCGGYSNYSDIDFNRFKQIESLRICPVDFNEFAQSSYAMQNKFPRLRKLDICYEHSDETYDMDIFLSCDSNSIPFDQITDLTLDSFGEAGDEYDFDSFCEILRHFPNVMHLILEITHLTDFNEDKDFGELLPALKFLNCNNLPLNKPAILLHDALIRARSNQLIQIDFGLTDEDSRFDSCTFNNLTRVTTDRDPVMLGDILRACDRNKLESINSKLMCGYFKYEDIITSLFVSFPNVKEVSMSPLHEDLPIVVSLVERALIKLENMEKKSLVISFGIHMYKNITVKEIELSINRIVNALDKTKIQDWRFIFVFPDELNKDNHKSKICKKFDQSRFLTASIDTGVVISNIGCKICGYGFDA